MGIKLIDPEKKKYRIQFWYRNRCYRKVVCGNARLAKEIESSMRVKLAEGTYFPARQQASQQLNKISTLYLAQEAKRRGHKPYINLACYIRRIEKFFGQKLLAEITPKDVQDFRIWLSETNSPIGQNRHQQVLCRLYNWAREAGYFKGENPASSERVHYESERKFWRTRFLSQDELKRLIAYAHPRIKPIIITAVFTGMRLGEIQKMRKKDINLDKCIILIPETKTGEPGWVPIPDTLYHVLDPILKVLPSPDNLVLDFLNFRRLWWNALKSAGLSDVHFHDLRHTYASHLMMKTGNPAAVQALLRHRTPAMTQRYAHLAPEFMRSAALTLDKQLCLNKSEQTAPQAQPEEQQPIALGAA